MSVEVKVDLAPLMRIVDEANVQQARGALTQVVSEDCAQYVPVLTGALQASGREGTNVREGTITWGKEYASHVYNRDYPGSTKNPNAQPHWVEYAKQLHGDTWAKRAAEYLFGGYLK